jgi:hypothetical protein
MEIHWTFEIAYPQFSKFLVLSSDPIVTRCIKDCDIEIVDEKDGGPGGETISGSV